MYNVHWDSVWPNVDGGSRRPGQETGYWAASQPERRRRHAAGLGFFSPFFSLFHHKHLRLCFFSPSLELSVECTETFLLSHALSVPSKNLGNVSNEFWLLSSMYVFSMSLLYYYSTLIRQSYLSRNTLAQLTCDAKSSEC